MKKLLRYTTARFACAVALALTHYANAQTNAPKAAKADAKSMLLEAPQIRTPESPAAPRINGPGIFGVRPGDPFLYHIPASGNRPMTFTVSHLPKGLTLDPKTENIPGMLHKPEKFTVTFRAKTPKAPAKKHFPIVGGKKTALPPPMGWNSWNAYH